MLLRPPSRAGTRRGVILLVVLALLTLFAILGLSFVMYSDAEATSARIFREAQTGSSDPTDITAGWQMFMGQFLYDTNDVAPPAGTSGADGRLSGLRGHSLGRTMYGWNDNLGRPPALAQGALNDKPYCGTGRLRETLSTMPGMPPGTAGSLAGLTGQDAINYIYFPQDGFVRDPGRQGLRTAANANNNARRGRIVGDLNVPYTYPDTNNMFLAMVDPSTGQVQVPSYYRAWLPFGSLNPTNWQTNPNWMNVAGKYSLLRPRPVDQLTQADVANINAQFSVVPPVSYPIPLDQLTPTQRTAVQTYLDQLTRSGQFFPFPGDQFGDVKNLDWASGSNNDSIWIDFGSPTKTLPDGTKVKLLVAPLVVDMDGRINLNTAGNILASVAGGKPQGLGTQHASNQGWGPWEVNVSTALNFNTTEWLNLFNGSAGINVAGKYGINGTPTGAGVPGGTPVHSYYPMDYNGVIDSAPWLLSTPAWTLPGSGGTAPFQIFPAFPPTSYGNANPVETRNHPSIYNVMRASYDPMRPLATAASSNVNFGANDLAAILRRSNLDGDTLSSNLINLLPQNLAGNRNSAVFTASDQAAATRRARVTTLSFDLDRPGVTPYLWQPTASPFTLSLSGAPPYSPQSPYYPSGSGAINFQTPPPPPAFPRPFPNPPAGSEYDASTWQSVLAALGRVDLGRTLTTYPKPDPATLQFAAVDRPTVVQATKDRQNLAKDIFNVLWKVTGAPDPASLPATMPTPVPPPPATGTLTAIQLAQASQFAAVQWLAQLAVNIVDFIDSDDYITPFNWMGGNWVYGTEMPRLVINEYYAQWDNNPATLVRIPPNPPSATRFRVRAGGNYKVNLWLELHNPFPADGGDPQNGDVQLQTPAGQAIYKVVVTGSPNQNLGGAAPSYRSLSNTTGAPDATAAVPVVSTLGNAANDWGTVPLPGKTDTRVVRANPGTYNSPTAPPINNAGFYILGSNFDYAANPPGSPFAPLSGSNPNLPTTFTSPKMSYSITAASIPQVANIGPVVRPPARGVSGATEAGTTVTITTTAPHGLSIGQSVAISQVPVAGYNGTFTVTKILSATTFTYTNPNTGLGISGTGIVTLAPTPALLLQRLANPYLPFNNSTVSALYNPYITVDYVDRLTVQDGARFTTAGPIAAPPTIRNFYSYGRMQPFAACIPSPTAAAPNNVSQWKAQRPAAPSATQPHNTFFRHNGIETAGPPRAATANQTLQVPFDVQYHPDRALASIADLLHVSAFKPHEFTQQFVDCGGNKFMHRARWTDQTTRLLRAWEFFTIRPRNNGPAVGGRIPGKININTAWDSTILQALFDPQAANGFVSTIATTANNGAREAGRTVTITTTTAHNLSVGQSITVSKVPVASYNGSFTVTSVPSATTFTYTVTNAGLPRSGTGMVTAIPAIISNLTRMRDGGAGGTPNASSRPFWGLATGFANGGDLLTTAARGVNNTLLQANTVSNTTWDQTNQRLLELAPPTVPATSLANMQPVQRFELLSKIMGNLTTRSNVFGVWATFGWFVVTDDATTPKKLGVEYTWPHLGNTKRHQMFAIVDRTQMQVWPTYKQGTWMWDPITGSWRVNPAINPHPIIGTPVVTSTAAINVPASPVPPAVPPPPGQRTFTPVPVAVQLSTTSVSMSRGTGLGPATTWNLQPGAVLTYDPDTDNEETVVVQPGNTATFYKSHKANCIVISRGNPGPWTQYDPASDPAVVPYTAQIN